MIDISRQKPFFPLRNFGDVERLFEFNIDANNGEPNLTLLSIVSGLIEHSLVTITDKDDLANNSRPVHGRKEVAKRKFLSSCGANPASSSSSSTHPHYHSYLSSTSNELNKDQHPNQQHQHDQSNNNRHSHHGNNQDGEGDESNEVGYQSSGESERSGGSSPEHTSEDNLIIPEIEFEIVETLYRKFVDQIKISIDFKDVENKTNLKIKKISDSVWEHLSNSYYKDKAHLQSIFSYLTTNKLDCFGLAFAVIAGCQILNLRDIYLALSEDHAWVMFDVKSGEPKVNCEKDMKEYTENNLPIPTCALYNTCEVTWHGKANSDKRGQPVTYKNCWLYTNGYAVKCDIRLCVAALVNSINPTINANTDSEILALLQQRLLWLLFKRNNYFPMSLGNLGELENINPTPDAPLNAHELFNLGIEISRREYNDSHVYPYSYLASYFFKHGRYKEALETWADSSAVMTKYNYSRDDEEIYKEFFEVANELIPLMLKGITAGSLEPGRVSLKPFLQDPECLALILKFYDNICCWEEGSSTPVLHIGWAKNFVATVLKFSSIIRSKIKLMTADEWTQNQASASECEVSSRAEQCSSTAGDQLKSECDPQNRDEVSSKNGCMNKNGHPEADTRSVDDQEEADRVRTDNNKTNDASSERDGESSSNEVSVKMRKRAHSMDDKVDTSSASARRKQIKTERESPDVVTGSLSRGGPHPPREKRLEVDGDNNVTVILKSRKIAGVRDLLQAERLNKTAIELQLTAQSQCAVRGRSNSSSYSSDFISSALSSIGGSTRSKRLHR